MMKLLFLGMVLCSGFSSFASSDPYPPRESMKIGNEITVKAYFKDSDTFLVVFNKEPDNDPAYVTPEALRHAIGIRGTTTDFIHRMSRENGSIYVLKNDLPILWLKEVEARKAKRKN